MKKKHLFVFGLFFLSSSTFADININDYYKIKKPIPLYLDKILIVYFSTSFYLPYEIIVTARSITDGPMKRDDDLPLITQILLAGFISSILFYCTYPIEAIGWIPWMLLKLLSATILFTINGFISRILNNPMLCQAAQTRFNKAKENLKTHETEFNKELAVVESKNETLFFKKKALKKAKALQADINNANRELLKASVMLLAVYFSLFLQSFLPYKLYKWLIRDELRWHQ